MNLNNVITDHKQSLRLPTILLAACILNIAIFYIIQVLVSRESGLSLEFQDINLVDFIRVDQKPEPPKPEKLEEQIEEPPPEETPPPPEQMNTDISKPEQVQLDMPTPNIDVPLSLNGAPYLGNFKQSSKSVVKPSRPAIDTSVIPKIKIPPIYPPRALRSGLEGVVTVEFTITTDGSVKDPVVVKAKPPKIFDKAVLKAIKKWKFNPEIVDGKAIEKRARQDVRFKLQK